jgi:hypothetical protein
MRLTVLDAYRVLKANGPGGGNPADVAIVRRVIAGTDAVESGLGNLKVDEAATRRVFL